MRAALTPAQTKAQDAWWIDVCGIPPLTLMERAAAGVAETVLRLRTQEEPVAVVCGRGNNAGDGLLAAALLAQRGVMATATLLYPRDALSPDARCALDRATAAGVIVQDALPPLANAVVVDAIFGVGLSRTVTGRPAEIIQAINQSGASVVAVDLPSGLDGLGGGAGGVCISATETVTFQHEKTGMLLGHGLEACGRVTICRIADRDAPLDAGVRVQEEDDVRALLPRRPRDSHKGKNGSALLAVGSARYTGAAMLCTKACLRAGAGIVTVLAPQAACEAVRRIPEAIPVDTGSADWSADACRAAVGLLAQKSAVGCGSGVGKGDILPLLEAVLESGIPAVFDADALNQLSTQPQLLCRLSATTVVTPHPGEMARLTGETVEAILSDPVGAAVRAARAWGCTVLLKGAGSVITDGDRCVLNTTGSAGLAKGGSGDVLTGIVTALLAQGLAPFDAACAGAYLLGASAGTAYRLLGERMLLASDVIDAL